MIRYSTAGSLTPLFRNATSSRAFIRSSRSCERVNPIARRSSSASAAVKPPSSIASRRICSWKSTTPERPLEDRPRPLIGVRDGLLPRAPLQVRVDGVALDRPGADDRDLDRQVVEIERLHPRERRHLRPALDLEDPDRVGLLHHPEHRRVVLGEARQVDRLAAAGADLHRVLEGGHHPEPEEVHLEEAHVLDVVLVPLQDRAPRHPRVLERHELVQALRAEDHPAGVLAEVARQSADPVAGVDQGAEPRVRVGHPRHAQLLLQLERLRQVAAVVEAREPVQRVVREPEHLAHLADRALAPVGDDVRGHRRAPAAVTPVHLLDELLPAVAAGQVEVDVGPVGAPLREEPLEEQLALDRVDGRDPEGIAHGAVGRASPALHK